VKILLTDRGGMKCLLSGLLITAAAASIVSRSYATLDDWVF